MTTPATTFDLRRFHYGDPAVPGGLPAGVVPAALAPWRGVELQPGWPLRIDLAARGEAWVRSLSEPESTASPADSYRGEEVAIVSCGPRAPREIATGVAVRRMRLARLAFAGERQELAATAEALLAADRARRPEGVAERTRSESMGGLGARFLDSRELAEVVGRKRAGAPFTEARRARLEAACSRLRGEEFPLDPIWVLAADAADPEFAGTTVLAHDERDLPDLAARAFDETSRAIVEVARAMRVVRLEAADAYVPEQHEAWLERLDWRGLSPEERLWIPPVFLLLAEDGFAHAMAELSRLWLSGRPVQTVLLTPASAARPDDAVRFEPSYFAVAHREVFVQQGSIAAPLPWAIGVDRALGGGRPGLHLFDLPPADAAGAAARGLGPWVVALARVAGRAVPLFRFDPEAGSSWARRLYFDENPAPDRDWPMEFAMPSEPAAGTLLSTGALEAPFTFADAALLDPVWERDFAPASEGSATARHGSDDGLLPVADWLAAGGETSAHALPFVLGEDARGERRRFVISRRLARATRDRLAFWRTIEELAGVRNEHVEAAIERARSEALTTARRERDELEARHANEVAVERQAADQRAVDALVAVLFEISASGSAAAIATSPLPLAASVTPSGKSSGPVSEPPREAAAASVPAASSPAAASEEAWVDTALCTSCDECVRKSPGIFAYNENKQAYVKNARGGTYRELVVAAESCTAKIIHPGTPWNPAEPDLDGLRARASLFS